jgi:hypothetical protein
VERHQGTPRDDDIETQNGISFSQSEILFMSNASKHLDSKRKITPEKK